MLGHALGLKEYEGSSVEASGLFSSIDQLMICDVLCTKSGDELTALIDKFADKFKVKLVEALEKRAKGGGLFKDGDFAQLMTAIVKTPRSTGAVDDALVTTHADKLLSATEKKMIGSDETPFVEIFSTESLTHIGAVVAKLETMAKAVDFEALLKSQHFSKPFRRALQLLHLRAKGLLEEHWARRLHKSMHGLGTDDVTLMMTVQRVHESGDMQNVKAAYYRMFGTTLTKMIKGDTGGFYRDLLLAMVGSDEPSQYGERNVSFEIIARGDAVNRSLLKTDDVFVLDSGGCGIFAWVGAKASAFERRHALHYAQLYLSSANLPQTTSITRVVEGGSNPAFNELIGI